MSLKYAEVGGGGEKPFVPAWPERLSEGPIFRARLTNIGEGWAHEGYYGLFDSYSSALASLMDYWEEYCEYFRTKGNHG